MTDRKFIYKLPRTVKLDISNINSMKSNFNFLSKNDKQTIEFLIDYLSIDLSIIRDMIEFVEEFKADTSENKEKYNKIKEAIDFLKRLYETV